MQSIQSCAVRENNLQLMFIRERNKNGKIKIQGDKKSETV